MKIYSKGKKFDILISHFLGVDHAGHKFGINNINMENKMKQMDYTLNKIIKNIDNDTLLILFGDHGI